MTGRRPFLAAVVSPQAAYFISRDFGEAIKEWARVRAAYATQRPQSDAVLAALAQLEEAGRQWHERVLGSEGGTSELPQVEIGATSEVSSLTTWLRVSEVAGRVEVSEGYVRRMCRSEALRARRVGGTWEIDEAAVIAWEQRKRSA